MNHQRLLGAWKYRLSANMYGWCVGDMLKSNMGGGRFACTPRGFTLEESIAWGCTQAKRKNVSFSLGIAQLPEELRSTVGLLVTT